MQTIELQSRAGADGILRLEIPAAVANTEYDVLIVLQPKSGDGTPAASQQQGWLAGFFEQTAGAWEGEPLLREPGYFSFFSSAGLNSGTSLSTT